MNDSEKIKVYDAAYKLWGVHAQMFMLLEEMSELQKEVCKQVRGKENTDNIIEEIADVEIMLEQLQYIALIPRESIEKVKQEKLIRLNNLIINTHKKLGEL